MSGVFSSTARAIRSGATRLVVGAIADGQLLKRVGATIVGVTASGESPPEPASAAEVEAGVDDAKYVTPKALSDAGIEALVPNITIPMILASVQVDLNEGTGAKQALYTCPANRRCIITNIVMQKFSAGVNSAVVTLGWNAAANDVAAPDLPDNSLDASRVLNFLAYDANALRSSLSTAYPTGTAADVLGLKVTTPEGSALTALVDVIGYWTDMSGVPVANVAGVAP